MKEEKISIELQQIYAEAIQKTTGLADSISEMINKAFTPEVKEAIKSISAIMEGNRTGHKTFTDEYKHYFESKGIIYTKNTDDFLDWFYLVYCEGANDGGVDKITEYHFKNYHEYKERLFNGGWSDEDEIRALKEKYSSVTDEKRLEVKEYIEKQFDDWGSIFVRRSDFTQFIFIATSFFNGEEYNQPLRKIETKSGTMNKTALKIRKCRDKFRSSISMTKDLHLLEFMRCLEMYDNVSEGEWGAGHRLYKELIKGEQKGYY